MVPSESLTDDEWNHLAEIVDTFSAAWEKASVSPAILEYSRLADARVRQALILELVKLDLENRWQRGLRRILEDYQADLPDFARIITPELMLEEYQIRRTAGDQVSPGEYLQRFPEHSAALFRLFRLDPALRSTMISGSTPNAVPPLVAGQQVDDFDLLLHIGQGAFASVFLARQRSMQRLVALKVSANQGSEPQTMAQLDHDNIIRVYDQRILKSPDVRLLYMQYAAGGTLADLIAFVAGIEGPRTGRDVLKCIDQALDARGEQRPGDSATRKHIATLSWARLVSWIGCQLAVALDYAHRRGVLHRDVQPANVLLTAEGVPQLADFNVSFGSRLEGARADVGFGGSLAYMSPEQLEICLPASPRKPSDLTAASDLYSLGVVLWELLTGCRPLADADVSGGLMMTVSILRQAHASGRLADDAGYSNPGDPETAEVREILKQCLEPDPSRRFQSGADLAAALQLCLDTDARLLLRDRTTRWKKFVRRWPRLSVAAITLIPNILMAVFNFLYNYGEVRATMPHAISAFLEIQTWINGVAFSTGILGALWLIRSVTQAVLRPAKDVAEARRVRIRTECLQLGNTAAAVSVVLWLIAGPVYPASLQCITGHVPASIIRHFVVSISLCGLIVAAYPFFGVSILAVKAFLPELMCRETTDGEIASLRRLAGWSWFHLFLSAAVPMTAVLILAVSGLNRRWALVILAVAGTCGVGLTTLAFRQLQRDLQTLVKLLERKVGNK